MREKRRLWLGDQLPFDDAALVDQNPNRTIALADHSQIPVVQRK